VWRVLRKHLHLKAYKLNIVEGVERTRNLLDTHQKNYCHGHLHRYEAYSMIVPILSLHGTLKHENFRLHFDYENFTKSCRCVRTLLDTVHLENLYASRREREMIIRADHMVRLDPHCWQLEGQVRATCWSGRWAKIDTENIRGGRVWACHLSTMNFSRVKSVTWKLSQE
jgi:hypothetical protein